MIPKVSIFLAVTTKIVTEEAQNSQKWQEFGQRHSYGRVIAREVLFLSMSMGKTKLCAKFGAILVICIISVVLGHEKTKIHKMIDCGTIDVFT